MKRFFIPLALTALTALGGYAQAQTANATVRICDANGCSDRDPSSGTFQGNAGDPVAEQRAAALTELAERDPRAAWDLGLRYFRGDGVKRDPYQALKWMREAGNQGNTDAQLALGRFYLMGLEEMGSDPAEAANWLSLAAAKGNKEAKTLLKQAEAAKKNEQGDYQVREADRKSWAGYWNSGYHYHWNWGSNGWYDRRY